MRKLYSSDDFLLVGHLREVLERNRIDCFTRNEHLIGGVGELRNAWSRRRLTEGSRARR